VEEEADDYTRHHGSPAQQPRLGRRSRDARCGLVRTKSGRRPEPTASIMDSQRVKSSTNVPTATQRIDAGKRIVGRKAASSPTPSACSSP
jgi:hypothetical protein